MPRGIFLLGVVRFSAHAELVALFDQEVRDRGGFALQGLYCRVPLSSARDVPIPAAPEMTGLYSASKYALIGEVGEWLTPSPFLVLGRNSGTSYSPFLRSVLSRRRVSHGFSRPAANCTRVNLALRNVWRSSPMSDRSSRETVLPSTNGKECICVSCRLMRHRDRLVGEFPAINQGNEMSLMHRVMRSINSPLDKIGSSSVRYSARLYRLPVSNRGTYYWTQTATGGSPTPENGNCLACTNITP